MNEKLRAKVELIRDYRMTPEEVSDQRVGFAYGNAPHDTRGTKEEVREAVNSATVPHVG
jgi:hypothetical protein